MRLCHRASMAANSPGRQDGRDPEDERLPLEEAIGQYVIEQPLVRAARERPEIALPWIVLGLAVAIAGLIGGMPSVLLVLLVGLPVLFGARLLASRRQVRPSDSGSPLRLLLLLAWVAALLPAIWVVLLIDAAAGNTGILKVVGLAVVLPIAGKALQMIGRV